MSSTNYSHDNGDEYVTEHITTKTGQEVEQYHHIPFYQLDISMSDRVVINDGTDTETVTISVLNGLEVARGTDLADATVLDYSGDVTLRVGGVETTKTLANGTVEFDLTTEKPAGSEIVVEAVGLSDRPAENDSATVEVIQA